MNMTEEMTINLDESNLHDAHQLLNDQNYLKDYLNEKGLVLVKNINRDDDALELASCLGSIHYCVDANANGITMISNIQQGKNINNSLAFTHAALYPHTDRSPIKTPPKYLLNWSVKLGVTGGDILLCDGKLVFEHLKKYSPKTCAALMEPDAAEFSDTMDTYIGPIFKIEHEKILIRFRRDNCIKFKPFYHEHIHRLYEAIDLYTCRLKTNSGEGYLVDNTRWLHGRTVFEGDRIIKRMQIYK